MSLRIRKRIHQRSHTGPERCFCPISLSIKLDKSWTGDWNFRFKPGETYSNECLQVSKLMYKCKFIRLLQLVNCALLFFLTLLILNATFGSLFISHVNSCLEQYLHKAEFTLFSVRSTDWSSADELMSGPRTCRACSLSCFNLETA